jgi:hypothetical protein
MITIAGFGLLSVIVFWGVVGYVAIHFIAKLW